jgi:RNA polymerase sigma-70 factor (ECF subfamily)
MTFFPQREKQAALFGGVVSVRPDETARDEDTVLLGRCRTGDLDAYGILVARHERRVQAIVGRIVLGGSDHRKSAVPDLEDLVQDVFVQAWRALPRFRGDARFSTWLYRIATNRALKEWKRMRAQSARIHETPLEDHVDIESSAVQSYDRLESPQQAFDIRMRDSSMKQAIDKLPEKQRTVILLHYYEECSCEDIATMLDCSVGTVWSRLHYGVKRLRESLNWLDVQESSAL